MTRLAVKHISASSSQIKRSGFTLLEVMIALAVFAITAIALLSQTNQSASQSLQLEEKAYALWIAGDNSTLASLLGYIGQY